MAESPTRFIGLDIHKEYFVAIGVNTQREIVFGPRRVSVYQLEDWILRHLTEEDAVVLETPAPTAGRLAPAGSRPERGAV